MKLPELVKECSFCKGTGKYTQRYNAGCGGGFYRSIGPCDYCKAEGAHGTAAGLGYVMKDGNPVPLSVINQIGVMNDKKILY